ncbi:hypothetical protein MY8738_006196, partial [Beauveria namnaoensis]
MSRAESLSVRDTPAAPAPSSSRGSNIPRRKPAPRWRCVRYTWKGKNIVQMSTSFGRRLKLSERARRHSSLALHPKPAGLPLCYRKDSLTETQMHALESIPGSTRITVFRPSQQEVLADNRRRWLSKLNPPHPP